MTKRIYDTSVRLQDDYFGHINNPWLKANPIPASESTWGTFYILRDASWKAVHEIIADIQKTTDTAHNSQLLKTYFDTALNFQAHKTNHIELLSNLIADIQSANSPETLAYQIGRMHRRGQSPFWSHYVELDDKDNQSQAIKFQQSGLSLPNRDYYLEDTPKMQTIRQQYQIFYETANKYISDLSSATFESVFAVEKSLATYAWPDAELRDVHKNYTKMSLAKLRERYATFAWDEYFKGLGWQTPNDEIIVGQPSYLDQVMKLIATSSLGELKAYMCWRILNGYLSLIDEEGSNISFDFYGRVLGGTSEIKPLWKRVVLQADSLPIGELLGQQYAERHFPASSKSAVEAMVEDIRDAYHSRIDGLTWMSDDTKKKAHRKLDAIKVFVGYPTKWKDFSTVSLQSDNHLSNVITLRQFETDIDLAKVGQKPAKEEWYMNAHTVNAYNHPTRMEIVFPAAILQPPFYNPKASYAQNLGGIGAVIGHEFTHGFDDQGADYDEFGMMNHWQTEAERQSFTDLSKTIADQANQFEAASGVFLQGELIMGEAIADIGGLQLAVTALESAVNPATDSDFIELFENFAICECGHTTQEKSIELAKTDPHPPSKFRVNCVVCHIDKFYEIYDLSPSDNLYLEKDKRSQIW